MKVYSPKVKCATPWYGNQGWGMETNSPYQVMTNPGKDSQDPAPSFLADNGKGLIIQGVDLPDGATSPKPSSKLPFILLYGALAFFILKKFNARPR
jgi:hypothetical protein